MRYFLLISFFTLWSVITEGKVKSSINCVVKGTLEGLGVQEVKIVKMTDATDRYPWQQLVELNDGQQIWKKYMINTWGGAVFLLDPKGSIVAINPSLEEIVDYLKQL